MKLRFLLLTAVVAAPFVLGGCATPATTQAMTVQAADVGPANPRLIGTLKVASVTGGKETNPLWTSQVDNAGFKKALEDSLLGSGYLAAPGAQPRYEVSAEMVSLSQPLFGLTLEVKSKVNYKLAGPGTDKRYPIEATGSATTSDAFVGWERLRIANERSILENIKAFLKELSAFAD
jgi:hypothetical protein